jgi:serine/threonine protein kinase
VADLVEKSTPRAGRNNFPIPEHSAVGDGPAVRVRLDAGRLNQPHVSPVAAVTGAATIAANAQVPADGNDIPFMPSLDFHHYHPVAPPKQVNVDELHLYQLMESGSVSHWEARVAEESRLLQKQAFPKSEQSVTDVIMSGQVSNESCVSLASDDPRNSIKHKRTDLTISTDSSASLQAAVEFSELELVEVIGGGGFGQVWKAIWRGTPVAVKVLTGSAQSKNVPRSILEEFAAEINLLRGMRHPNICLYMGACLDPPNRAIITELAANGSLWDALRLPLMPPFTACDGLSRDAWPDTLYQPDARHGAPPGGSSNRFVPPKGAWPWMLIKRVALGAARGMSYLHSGKPPILHRDLKSANILLDDSYTAKVCDFGLSRIKAQERSMTGNCGTVQWMAPEVLASQSYNEKADVFSYGIICWELLTQKCPYEEMSPIQCALAVLNRNHRPEIPKWCPPPLHALIRSCVKKNPDERPSFPQIILALDSMQ